jgi:hypothetical protein
MRGVVARSALVLSLLSILCGPALGQQPGAGQEQGEGPAVRSHLHFSEVLRLREGPPVRVEMRTWSVRGGVELDRLPMELEGTMIVQLRGGELETIIDGERRRRTEDEFWTVPAGTEMGLETEDDTATFDTIIVAEP